MKRELKGSRRPVNKAEAEFWDYAKQKGITLTRQGWPDYACYMPDGSLVVVEVKQKRSHRLKTAQMKLMLAMSQCGVRCYRWSPETGFERVQAPAKDL